MKRIGIAVTILLLSVWMEYSGAQTVPLDPFHYVTHKTIVGSNGAVVSAHALASQVGLDILKQGGNAIDAAIATQLTLAVVYPDAGNIGGGGFMLIHLKSGKNIAIDFRETAPAAATRDMYLDANGNPQMHLSQDGHLSAGVPGSVAGIFSAMKYAKLPFKKLIQPAIDLASKGFCITADQAQSLNETKADFISYNTTIPAFVKASPWKAGDTLIQNDLARTLQRILDLGAKGFYEGKTAQLIAEEMKKGRGIITVTDLKNYAAKIRNPLAFNYRGYQIVSMPLPSSGGIILEQCLEMSGDKKLDAMKFETPAAVQLMVEAERRAFADRAKFLGDGDFVKVPVQSLVSRDYLRKRMGDYTPGKAGNSSTVQAGAFPSEKEETTHFNTLDKDGNAVAVTTTLNGGYGSRTVVAGAGFLLNDEMDDFSVKPGVANMYGAVGAEANAIAPGKRMLSSMTPTIVLKNSRPFMVVGTPGGTTIPTSVYQTIVDIIDFKMTPQDAVNQPKFHQQWLPDVVYAEEGFPKETAGELEKMGYKMEYRDPIGRTEMILVQKDGSLVAVGDHRGDDAAAGY